MKLSFFILLLAFLSSASPLFSMEERYSSNKRTLETAQENGQREANEALLHAAIHDDILGGIRAIEAGANVFLRDPDGCDLVSVAYLNGAGLFERWIREFRNRVSIHMARPSKKHRGKSNYTEKEEKPNFVNKEATEQLRNAVLHGDIKAAKKAFSSGGDIISPSEWEFLSIKEGPRWGWRLIHMAALSKNVDMVEWVLSLGGFDINESLFIGQSLWTPLCIAAENGDLNMIKWLFKHGAHIAFSANPESRQPIDIAVLAGHLELVEWFLSQGALLNTPVRRATVLYCAALMGNSKILERLAHLAHMDRNDIKILIQRAICKGAVEVLSSLAEYGVPLSSYSEQEFMEMLSAEIRGNNSVKGENPVNRSVLWLIMHGLIRHDQVLKIVNFCEIDGLINALFLNEEKTAREFLENFFVVQSYPYNTEVYRNQFRYAFLIMVALGYKDLVRYALDLHIDKIDESAWIRSLEAAASTNNTELLSLLLPINRRFDNNIIEALEHSLYWATIMRNEEAVSFLLERATAFEISPSLLLGRTSTYIRRLSTQEHLVLAPIRDKLKDFMSIYLSAIMRSRRVNTEAVRDLEQQDINGPVLLPREIMQMIIGFAFQQRDVIPLSENELTPEQRPLHQETGLYARMRSWLNTGGSQIINGIGNLIGLI